MLQRQNQDRDARIMGFGISNQLEFALIRIVEIEANAVKPAFAYGFVKLVQAWTNLDFAGRREY